MPLRMLPIEEEFVAAGREAGGLLDITSLLEDTGHDPSGLLTVVDEANRSGQPLAGAIAGVNKLPRRRSVLFFCGDCDQFHDIIRHHCRHLDSQPHVLADNGGAILLDPDVTVMPGFNTATYWQNRIIQSVDMKFDEDALDPEIDPEVFIYTHFKCGQATALGKIAPEATLSTCTGKSRLKRISQRRRMNKETGRPFKIGALCQVDYGDRQRTYYIVRSKIWPVAMSYARRYRAEQASDVCSQSF